MIKNSESNFSSFLINSTIKSFNKEEYKNLSINFLEENYEQYSRNPIISDVFSKVKYIEEMGEGWDKIIDSIKKHPLKPMLPEIIDTGNSVVVTLFSSEEMVEKVDVGFTQLDARLTQELTDTKKEILEFIDKNGKIRSEDCEKFLKISRVTANKYFRLLIKKKLIVKQGGGKYTYYILKNEK